MTLSVLVPTVEPRRSLLSRMLWSLQQQLNDEVEVIVYDGWIPFGDKVTEMMQIAKGRYCMVADDDDMVASDFIGSILEAAKADCDYIAYKVLHLHNGKYADSIASSINGDAEWQKSPYSVHHKCPVKTEIAKQFVMGNHYRCDRDWSAQVRQVVKSEVIIDKHLYIYDYWDSGTVGTIPSDQNKDTQRDVGMYPYDKEKFIWY